MNSATLPHETLTVGQVTRYLKYLIEHDDLLGALSVRGEVCEFSRSANGHIYFSIKDDSGQIPCVLFRKAAMKQAEEIAELRRGVSVVVHGYATVYEMKGTCQLYVESVTIEGSGASFLRFERLKAKLQAEGLFAPERKRPLPRFPRTIALVTSPRGQAYHDVLHRLGKQYPFVRVIEAGVSVQGAPAADEMVLALDIINRSTNADVILLVRGGGSPEDLVAFNEERLVRAVFASRIPIVSGIGHELDVTMVDFVADVRAATPSLAAAAAVPDLGALIDRAGALHVDMRVAVGERIRTARTHWTELNRSLLRASPKRRLAVQHQRADELSLAGTRAIAMQMRAKRSRLAALLSALNALDPLAILNRGYSVLSDAESGEIIRSTAVVSPGKRLRAQVTDGEFMVRAEAV